MLFAGIGLAIFGARVGAWLALAGLGALLAAHLLWGILGYRSRMRRPWPAVAPLADDDDW